jgi:hypothetical protein
VYKSVKTKDGKTGEIILLTAPASTNPGTDFAMAFLLLDGVVVDSASCWTYNRTAEQELLLEDVDGDGFLDLAFRARPGWFGLQDRRRHTRPGDKRTWLYAYAITSTGFRSLFPQTDRELPLKVNTDAAGQPVALKVAGVPRSVREREMFECRVSVTNTSKREVPLQPGEWFSLEVNSGGSFMTYSQPPARRAIKPGETLTQTFHLYLSGAEGAVTLSCRFVPGSEPPKRPKR